MSELKTCLYDSHVALGAKMSPFAGFIMPIQYAGIVQEHLAVREHVGMFDVSHMGEIFVKGPDAEAFVNHIFTNEIRGFDPGKVLYGMMCYPDGGTVDDLLVYREYLKDHFLLVVNAANIEKDFAWIQEQAGGYDCRLDNASDRIGQIAVQGPEAEKTVIDVLGYKEAAELGFYTFKDVEYKGERLILSRTGYTGEDGFELYTTMENTVEIWNRLLKAGVQPCGLGCRDTLRFEAGLPLYGDELSPEISPVMAGLGMFCKYDKDFIGKEALLDQKAGNLAKMNKTLPIYFMSGDKDPVGAQGKGVTQSVEAFRKAGMQDVEVRLYPGGRHEMLNELNRDAVYTAVLAWLESKRK